MNAIVTEHTAAYTSDEARWQAVTGRDRSADNQFWFAVKTTSIYCRPSCSARQPRRENVVFYTSRAEARTAGFRPCKRCCPDDVHPERRHHDLVAAACARIDAAEGSVPLDELAEASGLSPAYFHKLFKRTVGVTPRQYAMARRNSRVTDALRGDGSVTDAIYDAGFGGSSRFYEQAAARLGMTAREFKQGGRGQELRYELADTWIGRVLIAATGKGLCAILFGDDDASLARDLEARFPGAVLERAEPGSDFSAWVASTLACIEVPAGASQLPLDVTGTAFQERVWRALREIPPGETASYTDVARAIGAPKSARAVARACGANPCAVVIPCHRVVRSDGTSGGYRWGESRKRRLLELERRR